MDVLVHNVHETTAIDDYNCLVRKLNRIFSDKVKTSVGLEIDIFDVHVVFRYCPLNYLDGYYPDYYCTDSAEVSDFFFERSHRCTPCSIELADIYTIYSMIIRRARELQYSCDDASIELRLKLLDIARKHNFDLLFWKCEQCIGDKYRAIFTNNKQEKYKLLFDISCYTYWNEENFEDLEKHIVRYLGNKEENEMTINELYDFYNLNIDLVNATSTITAVSSSLTNCFPSDSPIAKDAASIDANTLYPEHRVIARSKAAFYGVPEIKKVIFNDPATIILWEDGTKTVVKAQDKDQFDKEKGLAMAIVKKALGNEGRYYEIFKKWLKEDGENK